jgi:hypothetical protein
MSYLLISIRYSGVRGALPPPIPIVSSSTIAAPLRATPDEIKIHVLLKGNVNAKKGHHHK